MEYSFFVSFVISHTDNKNWISRPTYDDVSNNWVGKLNSLLCFELFQKIFEFIQETSQLTKPVKLNVGS